MTTYILILVGLIGVREAIACAYTHVPAAWLLELWEEEGN